MNIEITTLPDVLSRKDSPLGSISIEIKIAPLLPTKFKKGDVLKYEGRPTQLMVVGEDDQYLHTFMLGSGNYYGIHKHSPQNENIECLLYAKSPALLRQICSKSRGYS